MDRKTIQNSRTSMRFDMPGIIEHTAEGDDYEEELPVLQKFTSEVSSPLPPLIPTLKRYSESSSEPKPR